MYEKLPNQIKGANINKVKTGVPKIIPDEIAPKLGKITTGRIYFHPFCVIATLNRIALTIVPKAHCGCTMKKGIVKHKIEKNIISNTERL